MNSYVSYKVNTKTDLPQFDRPQLSVVRRYSDFLWLHEELARSFPGVIIPPLPGKHVVGRLKEPFFPEKKRVEEEKHFLAERKRSLEKFLKRISKHHLLRDNSSFKAFLEVDNEAEFNELKEATRASKKAKGFWQWASETSHSLQSKLGTPSERPKTEDDEKFEEICKYINSIEPQTAAVHKHTEGLVKRNREMSQSLYQVGNAFTLLSKSEPGSLGLALGELGRCAEKLSVVANTEADKEGQFFEEPIKDYVRMIHAVKQALEVRNRLQVTYETCLAEQQAKKIALDRAVESGRQAEAEAEFNRATEKVEAAKAEFDEVTQRIFEEVERFKREKLRDFKSIILDFVQLQIEYNQKVEQTWSGVLETVKALNANYKSSPEKSKTAAGQTTQ